MSKTFTHAIAGLHLLATRAQTQDTAATRLPYDQQHGALFSVAHTLVKLAVNTMTATVLAPLEIDGSLEQRDEIAAVAGEIDATYKRIRDDRDRATNVLRNIMLATGQRRFVYGDTTFELRPQVEFWCSEHSQPPYYCRDLHRDDNPVQVREVAVQPYLRITHKEPEA